jgi:hypothetical protein
MVLSNAPNPHDGSPLGDQASFSPTLYPMPSPCPEIRRGPVPGVREWRSPPHLGAEVKRGIAPTMTGSITA